MSKTFKDKLNNPAMQFISEPEEDHENRVELSHALDNMTPRISESEPNIKMVKNPLFLEAKTRRVQLLLRPSNYEKIKRIAGTKGISINDLFNLIIEDLKEG